MTVDSVRFHTASQVGGGQGKPLSAHVGETGGCGGGGGGEGAGDGGAGGGGVTPPGGSEQCATTPMVFTTSLQGSGRVLVLSVQLAWPTHRPLA